MALIKCSECGNTVSSRATVCPQCGCPINDSSTALQAVVNNSKKQDSYNFVCIIGDSISWSSWLESQ